jgi:hypothetical protein
MRARIFLLICVATFWAILAMSADAAPAPSTPSPTTTVTVNTPAPPDADSAKWLSWRAAMMKIKQGEAGCYQADYPTLKWNKVECGGGPVHPATQSLHPFTIGNTNGDYAISLSSGTFVSATGSFPVIQNVTSVTDLGAPNEYTLQINTNKFPASKCKPSPNCQGWEQFVFDSGGGVNIQPWLVQYISPATPTCPTGFSPGGNPGDCWAPQYSANFPPVLFQNLGGIILTATAAANGNDVVTAYTGGHIYTTSISDNTVGLAAGWTQTEFNVFAECCLAQGTFNPGAYMKVTVSGTATAGSPQATCGTIGASTTGETANLFTLAPCSSNGASPPTFTFQEASPPAIASISPPAVSAAGDDQVTITAAGLHGQAVASFGPTSVPCLVNGTYCTAVVPVSYGLTGAQVTVANLYASVVAGQPAVVGPSSNAVGLGYVTVPICTFAENCPFDVGQPPQYTFTCPGKADYYTWSGTPANSTTPPKGDFLMTGTSSVGSTTDQSVFVAACLPGTTNACVSHSIYVPVANYCHGTSPPPPVCTACGSERKCCRAPDGGPGHICIALNATCPVLQ